MICEGLLKDTFTLPLLNIKLSVKLLTVVKRFKGDLMHAHGFRLSRGNSHSNPQTPEHDALLLKFHELKGGVIAVSRIQLVTLAGESIVLLIIEGILGAQKRTIMMLVALAFGLGPVLHELLRESLIVIVDFALVGHDPLRFFIILLLTIILQTGQAFLGLPFFFAKGERFAVIGLKGGLLAFPIFAHGP